MFILTRPRASASPPGFPSAPRRRLCRIVEDPGFVTTIATLESFICGESDGPRFAVEAFLASSSSLQHRDRGRSHRNRRRRPRYHGPTRSSRRDRHQGHRLRGLGGRLQIYLRLSARRTAEERGDGRVEQRVPAPRGHRRDRKRDGEAGEQEPGRGCPDDQAGRPPLQASGRSRGGASQVTAWYH